MKRFARDIIALYEETLASNDRVMVIKDVVFYDAQSAHYSENRYPKIPRTYTQWFFKRRLKLTLAYVAQTRKTGTLLEIGCADGVVMRAASSIAPLLEMVGVDISPQMIEAAKRKNTGLTNATFMLRDALDTSKRFDVVLEVGVIGFAGVERELSYVHDRLGDAGVYVVSFAGTDSLAYRLGRAAGLGEPRPYRQFEAMLKKHFAIRACIGYGFFIPYLWRVPALARLLQPLADTIANAIALNLCHEKLYLLVKK